MNTYSVECSPTCRFRVESAAGHAKLTLLCGPLSAVNGVCGAGIAATHDGTDLTVQAVKQPKEDTSEDTLRMRAE